MISDERKELLGTGGGVVKALGHLGDAPFFYMNSDTLWIDGVKPNLPRLAQAFDPAEMDALLLLAPTTTSIGYDQRGDFAMSADGRLRRRPEREVVPFAYASAALLAPALFKDAPKGAFPADGAVRPRRRTGPPAWPAHRRHLDACRHAGGGGRGRSRR